jgi:hypothetical protein
VGRPTRLRAGFFASVAAFVGLIGLVAAAAPAHAAAAPAPGTTKVVIYGDSLIWEARDFLTFLSAANGVPAEVRSFGGTATCDWFDDMRSYLPQAKPKVVVFAFSGNNFTACMRPEDRTLFGRALAAKYESDTETAIDLAKRVHARVLLVGAPRSRISQADPNWDRIQRDYQGFARRRPGVVSYADGGRLIAPNGEWSAQRRCLPRERTIVDLFDTRPCDAHDMITVRAPDGAHFCPGEAHAVRGVTGACPRYSSGAFRYASNIVIAARRAVYGS